MKRGIAEPFTIDQISFRKCFSAPSLELFTAMIIGWALTVGQHTISRVILAMGLHESRHFASVYRFVGRGRWLADMVSYVVLELLLETLVPRDAEILLVVDDTLNKHRGKKITGAGWQHDGSAFGKKNRKGYGVCFVGLAVRLYGIADRVFCLPYAALGHSVSRPSPQVGRDDHGLGSKSKDTPGPCIHSHLVPRSG